MNTYFLAVDIGASSGRHILGWIENGKLCLEEVYRFPNGTSLKNGHQCWDHEGLVENIIRVSSVVPRLERYPLIWVLIRGELTSF